MDNHFKDAGQPQTEDIHLTDTPGDEIRKGALGTKMDHTRTSLNQDIDVRPWSHGGVLSRWPDSLPFCSRCAIVLFSGMV